MLVLIITETQSGVTVLQLKPVVQKEEKSTFSSQDYIMELSNFTYTLESFPNNPDESYTISMSSNTSADSYWHLGSILCNSSYPDVCNHFIKVPLAHCSGPGCGVGKWQDVSGQCYDINYYSYDSSIRKNMTFIWPQSFYGKYYSSCSTSPYLIKYNINCQ